MRHAGPIQQLIDELRRLPGVGARTAQRLAYHLLREPTEDVLRLAEALQAATADVKECGTCRDLTDVDPCRSCADPSRDKSVICVVEEPQDVLAIERTGEFRGQYHVLHGALSPVRGVGPESLRIAELLERVGKGEIREVITATNVSDGVDEAAIKERQSAAGEAWLAKNREDAIQSEEMTKWAEDYLAADRCLFSGSAAYWTAQPHADQLS